MLSDAAIANIVTGAVTITITVVGFLTLWVKLRYGAEKAEEAAVKAQVVENKLDANTATTDAVNEKADTIVSQTNGTLTATRDFVEQLGVRVAKLEEYNRESVHRVLDAVQRMHLKVAELVALQRTPLPTTTPPPGDKK